jgi:hypothetical protein
MTEQGKAQIQMVGAGLVGFAIVVGGGGALLVLPHGGSSSHTAVSTAVATPSASALSVPSATTAGVTAGTPVGEASAASSSPAPILPDSAREAAPAPSVAAAVTNAPAAPAPASSFNKLVASQHIDSGSSATSSASASAAAFKPKADKPMKKPFLAPKLDLSKTQSAVASSVHYGVTGRSELMGRAAGPVYNFSGKDAGAGQAVQVAAGSMGQQVDAAEAQVDSSGLNDHDKAVLSSQLNKAKQAVTATAAAPAATPAN